MTVLILLHLCTCLFVLTYCCVTVVFTLWLLCFIIHIIHCSTKLSKQKINIRKLLILPEWAVMMRGPQVSR